MKRYWVEFTKDRQHQPMTYWVHLPIKESVWIYATDYTPPLPNSLPGWGYPAFHVEIDGFTFRFASLNEIEHCIDILSKRVLPTSRILSEERGTSYGPNNHWLSRLPKGTKSWIYRQKAVTYLRAAREVFEPWAKRPSDFVRPKRIVLRKLKTITASQASIGS
jgi:hypothetical protein